MRWVPLPSNEEKLRIVLEENTWFFYNVEFEEDFEGYISSLTSLLLLLKQDIETKSTNEAKKRVIVDYIMNKPDGLMAVLTLLGFSMESLLRVIAFIRASDDEALNTLVNKAAWPQEPLEKVWGEAFVTRLIKSNRDVAKGLVNLFFEGDTVPILRRSLPLFEFKKLGFRKLSFSIESLVDTLIRYKTKGSYKARSENNPVVLIETLFTNRNIPFEKDVQLEYLRRKTDFVIPGRDDPKIIIESSYVVTTSSGMGDKAKTEVAMAQDIRIHYPEALFVGFIDGIGWYVRRRDLRRMVSAFHNVFTFKRSELQRFINFVEAYLGLGG